MPKPVACHMVTKFSQAIRLGSQDGSADSTSAAGFSAVAIITAKGNSTTTISGDSASQHRMLFLSMASGELSCFYCHCRA